MSIKDSVVNSIPRRFYLPLKYHYRKLARTCEAEMFLLPELVGDGKVAIDIGANDGIYSYALSKLCLQVESFEPIPKCAEVIRATKASNINVHNVALSSSRGVQYLHIPLINGKSNYELATFGDRYEDSNSLQVPVRTLDEYDFKDVSFIKIDVEGHERFVLKGAESTILREKPIILIEIEQRHLSFPLDAVFDQITSYGYSGFFFLEKKLYPISEFSYELHQMKFQDNVTSESYINNFIFK